MCGMLPSRCMTYSCVLALAFCSVRLWKRVSCRPGVDPLRNTCYACVVSQVLDVVVSLGRLLFSRCAAAADGSSLAAVRYRLNSSCLLNSLEALLRWC
jgi:hypothetical protein